jgi:hypothetical protein
VLKNLGIDIRGIKPRIIRLISEVGAVAAQNSRSQSAIIDDHTENEINGALFEAIVAALPAKVQAIAFNLREVISSKEEAIRAQVFEKASALREQEAKLLGELSGPSKTPAQTEELNSFMVSRLSNNALKTIILAREETNRLGHKKLGTAQLLLALIAAGTGVTNKIVETFSINLESAREAVEKIVGKDSGYGATYVPPFTPRADKALESAWAEARRLGLEYIDNEHLLLGIIYEGEGVGIRALESMGVDFRKMKSEILRLIGESGSSGKPITNQD